MLRRTLVLAACLAGACSADDGEEVAPQQVALVCPATDQAAGDGGEALPALSGPEGIVEVAGRLFIANANGRWDQKAGRMVYGPGFVTVLDPETMECLGQIPTAFPNPQEVLDAGGQVAVICSGELAMGTDGTMTPKVAGGIQLIDPATLKTPRALEIPISQPHAWVGFPGQAVYDAQGDRIFAGSGTAPVVFKAKLEPGAAVETLVVHDDWERNELTVPALLGGVLYVSSFNMGLLFRLDPESGQPVGEPVDVTETDLVEGPLDLVAGGATLFVLHTLSMEVAAFDPAAGRVGYRFAAGAAANRLAWWNGRVFVTNSLDNNLTMHDTATGETETPFAVFEPGSAPWDIAIAGTSGFVTENLSNQVSKVSLETGGVVARAR
jgi:hypothetical protein